MAKLNRDDVDKFHDYSIYVPKRTIYMGSEEVSIEHGESGTDGSMAERTIKNLTILEALSSDPITIIMNNIGGDEYHGLAIFDAIKACKSHVKIIVMGHAMSMGSIILQAADERVMAARSSQMIHYGQWSFNGHAKTGQKWAKEFDRLDNWMEQLYLTRIQEKNPDFTLKKLKSMLNHDTFLSAQQSISLGLSDSILDEPEAVK
jgi:ATP-dependent Clp protease protease subunit